MNEIVNQRECSKPMEVEAIVLDDKSYDSTIDEQRMGSLCDEIIAIIKDDRTNTKKAINSDSNSRSMALKQNDILMKCYESEFRREDTTDEQRASLLNKMEETAASSARIDEKSRSFQEAQLSYSHKRSSQLIGCGALMAFGIGAYGLYRYLVPSRK